MMNSLVSEFPMRGFCGIMTNEGKAEERLFKLVAIDVISNTQAESEKILKELSENLFRHRANFRQYLLKFCK